MSFPGARPAHAPAGARPIQWGRDNGWLAVVAPALLFLGHVLYGAMLPQTALSFALVWAALASACLFRARLRADLMRLDGLALPAVLFAAVIAVALWSLTSYVPGGPHPVWAYLGISPGAGSVDKSGTTLETLKLLALGCVFLVGLASGGSDARARIAINIILTLGGAYAAWAFLAFVTTRSSGSSRLEATFLSANTAGTLFATLFVLVLGPLVARLRAEDRNRLTGAAPLALVALLFLVCLFMTASRGAFLGAAAGMVAFGVLQVFGSRTKLSSALLAGGSAIVAVFALLAVAGDFLLTRLLGSSETVASRATIARVHWEAFLTSPLMGFGLGSFDTVNRTLLNSANFLDVWSVRAAHNIYLGWLEQAGLLGAIPMFACIAALMVTTARKSMRRSRATSLIFALLAADVVFLTHGVTDFALEMFAVSAMWAYLLGLQFSLAQGSSTR